MGKRVRMKDYRDERLPSPILPEKRCLGFVSAMCRSDSEALAILLRSRCCRRATFSAVVRCATVERPASDRSRFGIDEGAREVEDVRMTTSLPRSRDADGALLLARDSIESDGRFWAEREAFSLLNFCSPAVRGICGLFFRIFFDRAARLIRMFLSLIMAALLKTSSSEAFGRSSSSL